MPTLTFTIGKEYGRNSGAIPPNLDFCARSAEEDHEPHRTYEVDWEAPIAGNPGFYSQLDRTLQEQTSRYQGTSPINGMSMHVFNQGTNQQSVSLIGIPLEAWTGHRLRVVSRCQRGLSWENHTEYIDMAFVTDPAYPIDHQPSSLGPGHYHVPIDEWRRLKARVVALEVERDLRKGAAAGNSG